MLTFSLPQSDTCTLNAGDMITCICSAFPKGLSAFIDFVQAARSCRASVPLTAVTNLFWNGAQRVTPLAKLA